MTTPEHFKGKSTAEHLKEARRRGAQESHGTELPGYLAAAADSSKDTAVAFLLLWSSCFALSLSILPIFIAFGLGWTIWKFGRSALLGWNRLERLHRVIEEERWEIQHHHDQEKVELREMYSAKGFSGKLLEEVVTVLAADDNRLLQVMLEEELGLSLEAYEHPLKQGLGAGLASLVTSVLILLVYALFPQFPWGLPICAVVFIAFSSHLTAKLERRLTIHSVIWNKALALFSALVVYFLTKMIL